MSQNGRPPMQGAEDAFFERYNDALHRVTGRLINTSPENIEDACAYAWMQFVVCTKVNMVLHRDGHTHVSDSG